MIGISFGEILQNKNIYSDWDFKEIPDPQNWISGKSVVYGISSPDVEIQMNHQSWIPIIN